MRETPELSELDATIEKDVRSGFYDRDEVIRNAQDVFEEYILPADLDARVDAAIARQRLAQASWPQSTDCDRLDVAFTALQRNGITARQNFTCCNNCGYSEIGTEMEDSGGKRGFAFFHMQDTDRAVEGMGVMLSYGARDGGAESGVAIGREIAAAITAAGLTYKWNGALDERINVHLDWRRRMPETSAPAPVDKPQSWIGRLLGRR